MKAKHLRALAVAIAGLILGGCAAVKPFEREKLADPVMDPEGNLSKQSMQDKFYSTREGSAGGSAGVGGGCGCSK